MKEGAEQPSNRSLDVFYGTTMRWAWFPSYVPSGAVTLTGTATLTDMNILAWFQTALLAITVSAAITQVETKNTPLLISRFW